MSMFSPKFHPETPGGLGPQKDPSKDDGKNYNLSQYSFGSSIPVIDLAWKGLSPGHQRVLTAIKEEISLKSFSLDRKVRIGDGKVSIELELYPSTYSSMRDVHLQVLHGEGRYADVERLMLSLQQRSGKDWKEVAVNFTDESGVCCFRGIDADPKAVYRLVPCGVKGFTSYSNYQAVFSLGHGIPSFVLAPGRVLEDRVTEATIKVVEVDLRNNLVRGVAHNLSAVSPHLQEGDIAVVFEPVINNGHFVLVDQMNCVRCRLLGEGPSVLITSIVCDTPTDVERKRYGKRNHQGSWTRKATDKLFMRFNKSYGEIMELTWEEIGDTLIEISMQTNGYTASRLTSMLSDQGHFHRVLMLLQQEMDEALSNAERPLVAAIGEAVVKVAKGIDIACANRTDDKTVELAAVRSGLILFEKLWFDIHLAHNSFDADEFKNTLSKYFPTFQDTIAALEL